jgi:hypothetical protein
MEAHDLRLVGVKHAQFKINDVVRFTSDVVGDELKEGAQVPLVDAVYVTVVLNLSSALLGSGIHELVDDSRGQNRSEVLVVVPRERITLRA